MQVKHYKKKHPKIIFRAINLELTLLNDFISSNNWPPCSITKSNVMSSDCE